MGYLGRRIGLSQDKGDSTPGGAGGAVGGGILDLYASGYFERQDKTFNFPTTPLSGMTATGGVVSDYSDGGTIYRAHVFTSSGTFDVSSIGVYGSNVEYLVVAGGGGAGKSATSDRAGGGGAGGFRTNLSGHPLAGSALPVSSSPGSYTVTVGGGGSGSNFTGSTSGGANSNGNNSVFSSITSQAGGGGGSGHGTQPVDKNGAPGGSGGGAGYLGPGGGGSSPLNGSAGTGNTPPSSPSQGNPGGSTSGGGDIPVYWPGGLAPIVTPTADATDIYSFKTFDGDNLASVGLYGVVGGQNFS
jgi:hypothetical protein